jgi:hypothetical protein
MTYLPMLADVNRSAHPGGGTQITDASREGLVEDLFEAHLRHLDVAAKSAVVGRLVTAANNLDAMGFTTAVNRIDLLISAADQEAAHSPDIAEATRLIQMAKAILAEVDTASIRDVQDRYIYDSLHSVVTQVEALISSNNILSAEAKINELDRQLHSFSITDVAEALGGGGTFIVSKKSEAQRFIYAITALNKLLGQIVQYGTRGADVPSTPVRRREENPGSKVFQEYASILKNLHNRYHAVDSWTEHVEANDPKRFIAVDDAVAKIPNLTHLSDLDFYISNLDKDKSLSDQVLMGRIQQLKTSFATIVVALESIMGAY